MVEIQNFKIIIWFLYLITGVSFAEIRRNIDLLYTRFAFSVKMEMDLKYHFAPTRYNGTRLIPTGEFPAFEIYSDSNFAHSELFLL